MATPLQLAGYFPIPTRYNLYGGGFYYHFATSHSCLGGVGGNSRGLGAMKAFWRFFEVLFDNTCTRKL